MRTQSVLLMVVLLAAVCWLQTDAFPEPEVGNALEESSRTRVKRQECCQCKDTEYFEYESDEYHFDGCCPCEHTSVINTCGSSTDRFGISGNISITAEEYVNNLNCSWQFQTTPGHIFYFTFTRFSIEPNYDWVQLFEYEPQEPITPELSGYEIPEPFYSTTNNVLIWFSTDYSITEQGFDLTFTEIPPFNRAG